MELNLGWSAILGVIVWLLGLAYKYVPRGDEKWSPDGRRMIAVVTGLSVLLGLGQCLYEAQLTPLPAMPAALPDIVFGWVPSLFAWMAATVAVVFAASQGVYAFIRKVIFGKV